MDRIGDPGGPAYPNNFSNLSVRNTYTAINFYGRSLPVVAGQFEIQAAFSTLASQVVSSSFTSEADQLKINLKPMYNAPALTSLGRITKASIIMVFKETAATEVSAASATLKGISNPQGKDAKVSFQYGTSTSYGKSTIVTDLGSGSTALEASFPLTGLTSWDHLSLSHGDHHCLWRKRGCGSNVYDFLYCYYAHPNSNPHTHADQNVDSPPYSKANGHSHFQANTATNRNAYSAAYSHSDPDTDTATDCNAHPRSHGTPHSHAYTNTQAGNPSNQLALWHIPGSSNLLG